MEDVIAGNGRVRHGFHRHIEVVAVDRDDFIQPERRSDWQPRLNERQNLRPDWNGASIHFEGGRAGVAVVTPAGNHIRGIRQVPGVGGIGIIPVITDVESVVGSPYIQQGGVQQGIAGRTVRSAPVGEVLNQHGARVGQGQTGQREQHAEGQNQAQSFAHDSSGLIQLASISCTFSHSP